MSSAFDNKEFKKKQQDDDDGILPESGVRKRHAWNYTVADSIDLLADVAELEDEEDGVGCPLPSTPEDNQLLEAEVNAISKYYFCTRLFLSKYCIAVSLYEILFGRNQAILMALIRHCK